MTTIIERIKTRRVFCHHCPAKGPCAFTWAGAQRAARKAGWHVGYVLGIWCPACDARLIALRKQKGA